MMLTSERCNGIKTGYWSPVKKDELAQKLGTVEHKAPQLLGNICRGICLHRPGADKEHDETCRGCPVQELLELIEH